MEQGKIYEILMWASLSVSGFMGTYFLAGIKSYLKNMKSEIQEIKIDQVRNNEWKGLAEYRLRECEMNLKDLPCMNNKECP